MKVALLGGGGFRAPTVYDALRRAPLPIDELVLHDIDRGRLARIRSAILGLREESGERIPVRTTTDLAESVADASFVLCAIRVGGLEARVVDERVPLDLGVLGQETTGPAGIAFALRTVPVMVEIAETVAARAPAAWFVNLTNPAGLITEVVQRSLGARAIGICDGPAALCARVAAALGRDPSELEFDYVGLNHLGWLNAVRTEDGDDLLPGLLGDDRRLETIDEVRLIGIELVREMGALPNEYVVYHERADAIARRLRARSRGEVLLEQQAGFYAGPELEPAKALAAWRATRDLRHGTYMDEAWTTASGSRHPAETVGPGEEGYAAVAADVMAAIAGTPARVTPILDVANGGCLDWLDDDAVIEIPCDVTAGGVAARWPGAVPREQRAAIELVKRVERLTIEAALERSAKLALEAIALHPLVSSREIAERIWDGYVAGHAWIRETFA